MFFNHLFDKPQFLASKSCIMSKPQRRPEPIFCKCIGFANVDMGRFITLVRPKVVFSVEVIAENFSHLCRLDDLHLLPQPGGELIAHDAVADRIVLVVIFEKILFRKAIFRRFFFGELF